MYFFHFILCSTTFKPSAFYTYFFVIGITSFHSQWYKHTHTHTFYFLLSLGYSGFFVFSLSNSNGRVIFINCLQQQQLTLWYCAHSFVRAAAVHSTLRFLIAVINLNSLLLFHSLSLFLFVHSIFREREKES